MYFSNSANTTGSISPWNSDFFTAAKNCRRECVIFCFMTAIAEFMAADDKQPCFSVDYKQLLADIVKFIQVGKSAFVIGHFC